MLSATFWFTAIVVLLLWIKDGTYLVLGWMDLGGERLEIINDGLHGDTLAPPISNRDATYRA